MDAEGADQRARVIETRAAGSTSAEDDASKKKKKKKKEKGKDGAGSSGTALDEIISGGVRVQQEGEDGEEGSCEMVAKVGTVLAGTRTLKILDISGNQDIGSSANAPKSEAAIASFLESETTMDDLAAGCLISFQVDNCGLSEDIEAKISASIDKAKTKRAADADAENYTSS